MEEGPGPDHRAQRELLGSGARAQGSGLPFHPDTNTQTASLQSGEVHFIDPHPDIGLLDKLRSFEGVKVQVKSGTVWEHVAFNVEAVPNLQDAPGDSLWHKSQAGSGRDPEGQDATPLQSVLVPDQTPYYTPAWADLHDPDKGKQLVQQAKSEGASTEITFSTTSSEGLRETLQQVASNSSGHRHHDKHKEHLGRHLLRPVVARG